MQNDLIRRLRLAGFGIIALGLAALSPLGAWAQNTVCAVVKLQLGQQAALEREAFNASLGLTNNLGDLPLSQLRIDVLITDPNGNPANSLFFIKTTNLQNVNAIDGTGTVQPAGSASANWLIIPSTGAGGSGTTGVKYNVTARMSFYTGGVPRITTTFPVAITVKPQPVLFLQYALPFEIFGPQPLLPNVSIATEPFPLGLRVVNVGSGTANNFSVNSAQPTLVDNAQGLAINFNLLGSYLGSTALTSNSLNIVYGDVQPGGSKQAAWIMASSFAGRFIDFNASFTHAATLGGALTSLIQGVSTYTLIKDVLDDTPGRDSQFDFLINASVPRSQLEQNYEAGFDPLPAPEFIMESDLAAMTPVQDVPGVSSGTLSGSNAVLGFAFAVPVATGTWVHAAIPFSLGGSVTALSAVRSDGKVLNPHNFWISKHFNKSSLSFSYKLHVLDFTSAQPGPQSYALTFGATSLDTPPDPISNLTAAAAATPGALNLNWNATGEDGSTGTIVGGKYAIFASTDLSVAPNVAGASVVFSTSTPALAAQGYTLRGLLGNATYQLAVFIADAAGHYANGANVVLANTLAVPPAVAASSVTASGFALSWSTAVNAAGAQYRLQLSTAPGSVAADTGYSIDASSAVFAGLGANTGYLVTALMKTSTGAASAPVAVATVTTLAAPPSPAAVTFVGISSAALTAQWQYGADPSDTEFLVELSTAPDLAPATFSSGWTRSSSFTFVGLASQSTYFARVKARSRAAVETAYVELGSAQTSAFAITPESGSAGSAFTLSGAAFGPFAGSYTRVRFGVGGPLATISSWNTASITGTIPGLSAGTYTILVERQSGATVTTLTGGTFTLLAAPATGIVLALDPADGEAIATSTPTVTASYAAALGIATSSVHLTLDGAPIAALVTASTASFVPAALSEGTHTVTASVADLGGSVATATSTFLVDTIPPVTALSVDGLAASVTTLALISTDTLSLSATDAGSGVAFTAYLLDVDPNTCDFTAYVSTAAPGTCLNPYYAGPFALSVGTHTLAYYSDDVVGNSENYKYASLTVVSPVYTAASADGVVTLLSGSSSETVTGIALSTPAAAAALAQGLAAATSVYDLEPGGAFPTPATLRFRFNPGAVSTDTLSIYTFDGTAWDSSAIAAQQLAMPTTSTVLLSGTLAHASPYGVFSKRKVKLASIAVAPSSATLRMGATLQFTAAGTFTDGSSRTLTASDGLAWATSASTAATVNAAGVAAGAGPGAATITVSSGAVSGSAVVTVFVPPSLVVSSVAPSTAIAGASVAAIVAGAGFDQTAVLSLEQENPVQGAWSAAAPMSVPRSNHRMTVLRDGRVLITGGSQASVQALASVEIFDPASGTMTSAAPMATARMEHAAALLADGRVLVAGGSDVSNAYLASAEIYDPAANAWSPAGSLSVARYSERATLLSDGRVLVAGGYNGNVSAAVDLYDPVANAWTTLPSMATARANHRAALLPNGRVIEVGGTVSGGPPTNLTEIYDPVANSWSAGAPMNDARLTFEMGTLGDGRLVAAAGDGSSGVTASAEIYDPRAGTWTRTGSLATARYLFALVPAGGGLLAVGGQNASQAFDSTELFDPIAGAWTAGPRLTTPRGYAQAVALADGRPFTSGGIAPVNTSARVASAELLNAPVSTITATGVAVADAQHLTGSLNLAGAATGYWDVVVRESAGRVGRLSGGFQITAPIVPPLTLTSISVVPSSATLTIGATQAFAAVGYYSDGSSRTLSAGGWSVLAPMPTARVAEGADAINGVLYAVGGYNGSALSTLEAYNPQTNAWTTKPAMPTARLHLAAGAVNGVLYAVGGQLSTDAGAAVATLEAYDPAANAWTTKAPMPTTRTQLAVGVLNGVLYAVGGFRGAALATVEAYDPTTNSWTTKASLNTPRMLPAVSVVNGVLYVAGGNNGSSMLATVEAYDPVANAWTYKASMPTARFRAVAGTIDGRMVVAGGQDATGTALTTVEAYAPSADAWTTLAPLPAGRHTAAGGIANDVLYVAGGQDTVGNVTATLQAYAPAAVAWSSDAPAVATVTTSGVAMGLSAGSAHVIASSGAVSGSAAVTVTVPVLPALSVASIAPSSAPTGASLSAAATGTGFDASAALSLEYYRVTGGTWTATGSLGSARFQAGTVVLKDGRVLTAGGQQGGTAALSSVEIYDPVAGTWSAAAPMAIARLVPTLITLKDGRVLAAGGRLSTTGADTAAAEIYDPASNSWTAAASMPDAVQSPPAILLSDGRVLLAGGGNVTTNQQLTTAQIYDPVAGTWSTTTMSFPHSTGALTTLNDGRVLVAGGASADSVFVAGAEIFNPATDSWTTAAPMAAARQFLGLATLPDGRAIAAGGTALNGALSSSEIYDPVANSWTAGPSLSVARYGDQAIAVDGRVLVISGQTGAGVTAAVDVYEPLINAWQAGRPLNAARETTIPVRLADGRVLVTGGYDVNSRPLASTELLVMPVSTITATGVSVADAQHLSGSLSLAGAAAGYWDVVVRESGNRSARLSAGFRITTPVIPPPALTSISVVPSSATLTIGATQAFAAVGYYTDGSSRTLSAGGWSVLSPMPTARVAEGADAVNGVLYAAGGYNGSSLSTLEAYNPLTGVWTTKASMPTARLHLAAGAAGGVLYAVGGQLNTDAGQAVATLEAYDPVANAWTTKAPMSAARTQLAAGVLNGVLYAIGGFRGAALATVEAYDPTTNSWTTKASLNTPRMLPAVSVVNGVLYVAGGNNGSSMLATVEAYDPVANVWTYKANMPMARFRAVAGTIDGRMVVAGGQDAAGNALTTVEAYAPSADAWTTLAPLPAGRHTAAGGTANDVLYVTGGQDSVGNVTATLQAYAPATVAWTSDAPSVATVTANGTATGLAAGTAHVVASSGTLSGQAALTVTAPAGAQQWAQLSPAPDPVNGAPSPRIWNTTVYNPIGKRLIVFGGGGAGGYGILNDAWVLTNADGTTGAPAWIKLNPAGGPPPARESHVAVYDMTDNRMIVYGGYTTPGNCGGVIGDVWVLSNADGTGGTPTWTQLAPTGTAPARRYAGGAYDPVNNRLIVNGGGSSGCGAGLNDTWVLTNANGLGGTPAWIQLSPSMPANFPSDSSGGSAGYDAAHNVFLRFIQFGQTVTTWELSNGNGLGGAPAWTQLAVAGAPAVNDWVGRDGVYDQGTNDFAIFGAGVSVASETWVLAHANGIGTPAWTKLTPSGPQPDARVWGFLGYAPSTARITMYGGSKDAWNGTNEVWTLTNPFGPPAPSAVSDLAFANVGLASATLTWTAPTSPAAAVAAYDLRVATFPITAGDFASASPVSAPSPAAAGTPQSAGVPCAGPSCYAALLSRDALGGVSGLSNVAGLTRSTISIGGVSELVFTAGQPVTQTLLSTSAGNGAVVLASATAQGLVLVSSIYDLGPEQAVFTPPATLTIAYSTATLYALGLAPSDLRIYEYVAGAGWVAVSTQTLNAAARNATASVPTLSSIFALFGRPHAPPQLALSLASGTTVAASAPVLVARYAGAAVPLDLATVRLRLDGVDVSSLTAVAASSAQFAASGLVSGAHAANATLTDAWGANATAALSFLVDAAPPVSTLSVGGPQYASSGTVYVSTLTPLALSAVDPVVNGVASGVRGISVAQSSGAFSAYAGTFTLTAPDGARSLSWYAVDNVGNQEVVKSSTVLLDATAPQTSLAVLGGRQSRGPDAASFYASSDTRFGLLAADPPAGGVASGVAWTKYQDSTGAFLTYLSTFALSEGAHPLGYQSQDNVANLEVLRSTTALIDATPPVTTVAIGSPTYTAADGTVYVTPAAPVTFTAADPALPTGQPGSGVARIEVSIDGAAFAAYTASLTFAEGRHTVAYRSVDNVGNVEATRTLALQSDATPPLTTLAVSTRSSAGFVSAATLFTLTAADPAVNGVASGVSLTRYRVNGGAFATAPLAFRLAGPDGAYQVDYQSQDNVMNLEVLRSTSVFLDQTPPVTTPHLGTPNYVAVDGTQYVAPATPVTFTAVDPSSGAAASGVDHIEVALDGGAFTVYAATLTFAEGRHTVLYRAVDNAGNVEATKTLSLQSDATPPVTAFKASGTYYAASAPEGTRLYAPLAFIYSLPAADPVVNNVASGVAFTRYRTGPLTSYASGSPIYAPGAFASYSSTFSLAEGIRRVDFQSQDNVGNQELLKSATVFVDATPPVTTLTIGAPQYAAAGTLYVSTATPFSLASQDPLIAEVASGVSGVFFHRDADPFASYASTFTIATLDGVHTASFYAADNVGNLETAKTSTAALDATPPQTSLLVAGGRRFPGPDGQTVYASSDTRFALPAVDPVVNGVASGLAFTRWQDNGGAFTTYVSTLTLAEGAHKLAYQSQDNVANLEVLSSTNVWIDATPPVTTVTVGSPTYTAADGTIYVTPAAPITFAATDPNLPTGQPGSGVNRIEIALDGGAYAPYSAALRLAEGRHVILYRAIDDVGNVEATRTLALQSDATPPVSSLVIGQPQFQLPGVLLVSSRTPFAVAAVDPVVNGVASGVKDSWSNWADLVASTSGFTQFTASFTLSGLDANKVVSFYSRDNVLNTEVVKSSTVLLDSTPPEIALLSPSSCDSGLCRVLKGRFPVLGTARDPHLASYVLDFAPGQNATTGYALINAGTIAVSSGALGTWDASALSGWQTLRLTATDQVANVSVLTVNVFVGDPATEMLLGNHDVFNMPTGVAVGGDGKIYVADRDDDRVAVFSSTGTPLASFGTRHGDDDDVSLSTGMLRLNQPMGVAVDPAGDIFVADTGHQRVLELSATGQVLLTIGRRRGEHDSRRPGAFNKPTAVALDALGDIYVSDTQNHRVQVFSSTGTWLSQIVLPAVPSPSDEDHDGDDQPTLGKPLGLALDAAGRLYVADAAGHRLLEYGTTGNLLLTIPIPGDKPGQGGSPFGVAVSTSGDCLLVSDARFDHIYKFDFMGAQNLAFGARTGGGDDDKRKPAAIGFRKLAGLALDAAGNLYAADRNAEKIEKFGLPTGQPTLVVPPPGPGDDDAARDVVSREDGGKVERKDKAAVAIPAQAVSDDLKVSVSTPAADVAAAGARGAQDKDLKTASPPVDFGPEGTKFSTPVTLTLPYSADLVARQNGDETSLKVHYWNKDKGHWEELDSQVDLLNHMVTAKTSHFSLYQVFATSSNAITPLAAADVTFGLKAAYVFPNPVRGTRLVTLRVQPGLADSVEVHVYDVTGRRVYGSSAFALNGGLAGFDDGNGLGAQLTYDNVWDVSGIGSGVYMYVITARKAGQADIHKSGKIGVIK